MAAVGRGGDGGSQLLLAPLRLEPLDWGPAAREALPKRRYSNDDIVVGYGGLRINEKRYSIPDTPVWFPSPRELHRNRPAHVPRGGWDSTASSTTRSHLHRAKRKTGAVDRRKSGGGASNQSRKASSVVTAEKGQPLNPIEDDRQKKIVTVFVSIGFGILIISILLVTVTLRLSPRIDEMVRKENEQLLSLLTQPGGQSRGGVQESNNAFSSTSTNPSTETPGPVPVQADVHAGGEA